MIRLGEFIEFLTASEMARVDGEEDCSESRLERSEAYSVLLSEQKASRSEH